MRAFLFLVLFLSLSGCPTGPVCEYNCGANREKTWGVQMDIEVKPGAKASSAEVEVTITRPGYDDTSSYDASPGTMTDHTPRAVTDRAVKKGEFPYDEEVALKLHWSCPTLEKSGEVEVTIKEESATSKIKIDDLPPQPLLVVYPWEFKRGLECILITEDEKIAQEKEEKAKQDDTSSDDDEDVADDEDEVIDKYEGERAFFIKKPAPEVKLSEVALVAGNPDSYADIKVELLRNDVAVVAGDRSYDLEVEVKLPWTCEGTTPAPKPGDTHIVIPAGASSAEARLIMPAKQAKKLTCAIDANALIDNFIIGNNAKTLELDIPAL